MATCSMSSKIPSSKTSSCVPPAHPPLMPSPPLPPPPLSPHISSSYSLTETSSRGEKFTPSSFSHCCGNSSDSLGSSAHQSGFPGNAYGSGNPTDNCGKSRQSCYSASTEPELDDDWGFDLDDVLAKEESHYLEPSLDPPNLEHPLSCGSETPQPCNSEPVGAFSVPKSAASHSAQSSTSSYLSAHSNTSSYHSTQTSILSAQSSKASSPSTSAQLSPPSTSTPYSSIQTSKPSAKKPFRPPFLQQLQESADEQGLNTSFGRKFGKPSMFKPSGNNEPPKDDAAEFRGQYEHKREMYKIFNQVSSMKIIIWTPVMDLSNQNICIKETSPLWACP